MPDLRLVICDVDGTLVDSQAEIMAAMVVAFDAAGLAAPDRSTVLSIVGLSLAEAFAKLCPDADPDLRDQLVQGYKDAFNDLRGPDGNAELSPLFPGHVRRWMFWRAKIIRCWLWPRASRGVGLIRC